MLRLTLPPAILCRTRSSSRPSLRYWPIPRTTSSTQRSTKRCCQNPSSSCFAPKCPVSWGPTNSTSRPKTQVLKTPDSLALRAGSPYPQTRNSLLSLEKKKIFLYRPQTLLFCLSSFLSLYLSAFLSHSLSFSPVFPFPTCSLEKPFSAGSIPPRGEGTVPPSPPQPHFPFYQLTSLNPSAWKGARDLPKEVGLVGNEEGEEGFSHYRVVPC